MNSGIDTIPDKWMGSIMNHLSSYPFDNGTIDYQRPYVRKSLQSIYPIVICFYVIVMLLGSSTNIAMVLFIIRHRLFKDPMILFLANGAVSDVVKCLFLLPLYLCNLLFHNWIFGRVMCFFLPVFQHFPFYVNTLTFLLMAIFRYWYLAYLDNKPHYFCVLLFSILSWIISVCVSLKYAFCMEYIKLDPALYEISFCFVIFHEKVDVSRYTFVGLFILPLLTVLSLHVRSLLLIKMRFKSITYGDEIFEENKGIGSGLDTETSFNSDIMMDFDQPISKSVPLPRFPHEDFDPPQEKRTQKYVLIITLVYIFYVCPINILYFCKQGPHEIVNQENNRFFDIAYITLVLLAFVPSCITPALFTSWIMKRPIMDQIFSYFWTVNFLRRK